MPAPEGTDKSFEIGTGQARVLTSADFSLTSSSAAGITLIVVFAPAQGTIEIDGVRFTGALMMSTAVIEAGRLRYVAPDHATVDALAFSLVSSDGIDLTAANLVFDVASSIDTPPQFSAGDAVLGLDLSIASDDIRRLVVDDDGRITTLHSTVTGADFALVRVLPSGTFDPSFGSGTGRVTFPSVGTGNGARDLALLPDGGYLVVEWDGPTGIEVTRLRASGALDLSFAGDGQVEIDVAGTGERGRAVIPLSDGGALIVFSSGGGTRLMRLTESGTQDTSFGDAGVASGPRGTPTEALQLPDGRIVVVGMGAVGPSGSPNFIARFNVDGMRDASFGTNGTAEVPGNPLTVWDAVAQADGKIIVLTSYVSVGVQPLASALYRYNTDGSVDTSFGTGGRVLFGESGNAGGGILLQPDGKIVASSIIATDLAVARFDASGQPDPSFGTAGVARIGVAGADESGPGLGLAPDGGIVVGGRSLGVDGRGILVRLTPDGHVDAGFGAPSFVRGGAAVPVDPDVGVLDREFAALGPHSETATFTTWDLQQVEIRQVRAVGDYGGATVTLHREGGASTGDVFSGSGRLVLADGIATLDGAAVAHYTQAAGTLNLTFDDTATTARVHDTLRSIAYANTSEAPPTSVRLVWTFSDGAHSATAVSTVHVVAAGATVGNDTLVGTLGADRFAALAGNDRIEGRGGDDIVDGGPGVDTFVHDASTADVLAHPVDLDFSPGRLGGFGSSLGMVDLSGVERVHLADGLYAFDTFAPDSDAPGGDVWQAAALLRAGFGAMPEQGLLSRWTAEADRQPDIEHLAQALLDAYAPGIAPAILVEHLFMTVFGIVPSPDTVQVYASMVGPGLPFETTAELFAAAAILPENAAHMVQFTGSIQALDPVWFETA